MQCKSLWIKASAKCVNVNVYNLGFLLELVRNLIISIKSNAVFPNPIPGGTPTLHIYETLPNQTHLIQSISSVELPRPEMDGSDK